MESAGPAALLAFAVALGLALALAAPAGALAAAETGSVRCFFCDSRARPGCGRPFSQAAAEVRLVPAAAEEGGAVCYVLEGRASPDALQGAQEEHGWVRGGMASKNLQEMRQSGVLAGYRVAACRTDLCNGAAPRRGAPAACLLLALLLAARRVAAL